MTRQLIAYVHVDGVPYGPDDKVPAKIAERIGAHAWTNGDEQVEVSTPTGGGDGLKSEAPPRTGRGSGIEAWLAFAEQHDVGTDSDMTRDDVIAACEAAGVIEPDQPKE
ncbi:hypothetical protein [Streptomyces sp. NPDC005548]|uniref:hypothetical protein n=1 Tax=Streptomyces sp. NPDC005548 TaxID=3364724 RepID=UPI00369D877A